MLLSTGEQVSISLLAMALHEIGIDAISYTGSQIKMMTDGNFSKAKIESISTDRIVKSLRDNKVVIVAGFQGIDAKRISPRWAGAVPIPRLWRWPRSWAPGTAKFIPTWTACILPTRGSSRRPVKLKEISYDEMLELARLGAAVLHSRSVEFAKKYNIRLHVRSSFNYEEGTIVMPKEEMMEKFVISGVTAKRDEAKITIRDIPDRPGIAARLFGTAG